MRVVLLCSVGVLSIGAAVLYDRSVADPPATVPRLAEPEPWAERLSVAETEKAEALARDAVRPAGDPAEWDAAREAELVALRRMAGKRSRPPDADGHAGE